MIGVSHRNSFQQVLLEIAPGFIEKDPMMAADAGGIDGYLVPVKNRIEPTIIIGHHDSQILPDQLHDRAVDLLLDAFAKVKTQRRKIPVAQCFMVFFKGFQILLHVVERPAIYPGLLVAVAHQFVFQTFHKHYNMDILL